MKTRLSRTLRSTARFSLPLTSAIVALLTSHSAIAGNSWDGGGGNGFWNTGANWNPDGIPSTGSSGTALNFVGNVQNITTNNLAATDPLFSGIVFQNNGTVNAANPFTLAGNRITLGGNITTAANTAGATITDTISLDMILNANSTITTGQLSGTVQHNLTISGIISETGGARTLTKSGDGTLILSGANTYTGTTTVTAGTLTLSGNRTAAAGGITLSGTGTQTLNIQGGNYTTLAGTSFNVGSLTGTATVNHSAGTITLAGAGLNMGVGLGSSTSVYNLSGGSLTTGAAVTLGANNGVSGAPHTSTFNVSGTGAVSVANLRIGNNLGATYNTTSTFNQTAGTTTVNNLSLGGSSANAANSTGSIIANLNLTGGTFTATNITSISAGGATTVQNANSSFINIGGNAQVTLGTFGSIVKGQNSTATITFDSGATGFLAPVAASTNYMNAGTFTSAFLTANGAKFNVGTGKDITIGQVLENASGAAGTLTKSGAGVLTLSGNNTYTGLTTVSSGTLAYGANDALSTGNVTVNGGTLALSNFSDSVGTVTLTSGNITGNTGVLSSTGTFEMQSGSVSAILGGTSALNKTTSGTVTLSGANTYTGDTTVSAGTLELGDGGSVSGNIINNATFSINRTDSSTLTNVISGTGALTKSGAGTVTLSAANTYTNTTTVTGGTLTLSGNRTADAGGITLSGTGTQTLNIQGGNYTTLAGTIFSVGSTNGTATVNHSAGTITLRGGGLQMGVGLGSSTSVYNLSGGSLTTGANIILGLNNGTSAATRHTSTFNVSGTGALSVANLLIGNLATSYNTTSTFNQTAGTTTVNNLSLGGSSANATNSTGSIIANLNLTGGTFTATNITSLSAGGAASASDANSSFINIGGDAQVTLGTFGSIVKGQNSTATITFDTTTGGGGFLAPVAASTTYMNAGTFTSAFLTANGANFNVGSGKDITVGQVLENASGAAGTLTKSGVGVLTLSGNNTYTGATTLSAGTLSVATIGNGGVAGNLGQATAEASNLVFAGGALRYTGATASSDRSFTMTNAAVNSINVSTAGSTLTLTGSSPTNTGLLQKDGAGNLTLAPGAGGYSLGSINANGGTLTLGSGTFTTTGTDPTANAGYNISAGARNGGTLTVDGAALTVTPGGGRRFVIGGATSGTGNLLSGSITADTVVIGHDGSATMTQSGGTLTTGDLYHQASGNATYTMTGGILTAKSIRYITAQTNSSGNSFTFSMDGGTVQAALGTTDLFANNTSTGTLQMAVQLGSTGATIDTSLSDARIVRPLGNMSGQAGTLTKIGANTLTLLGNNTYTGATTVSAGTLLVDTGASVAASTSIVNGGLLTVNGTAGRVTVNSGGSLGGSGTVGAVTLTSGSLLKPGNSPGLLTASEATWAAGSTYQWEINNATGEAGDNWDLFSVTGALDMSALSSSSKMNLVLESLSLANYSTTTPFSWTIAKAGSFTGTGWDDGTNVTDLFNINATAFNGGNLPTNGFKVEVGTSGDLRTLNLMAIPEPNTRTLLLAGSLVGFMALRRRRA